ncbi:ion channel, partial [Streptomyces sp. NPDC006283]|uniref:ion channel n=1 Tax=Streptomyces sp. NPDC006283 TaxID=3156741 RepID=UPI0033B24470
APAALARVPVGAVVRPLVTVTGLTVAYYLLPMDATGDSGSVAALVLGMVGVAVLFGWHMRAITLSPYPRLRAAEAIASTLSLFLLLLSTAYYLLEHSNPGSFSESLNRTDALYFTLTTFTTVGFGDITAVSGPARVMTMLQMLGNLVLVGVAGRMVVHAVQRGVSRRDSAAAPPGSRRDAEGQGQAP